MFGSDRFFKDLFVGLEPGDFFGDLNLSESKETENSKQYGKSLSAALQALERGMCVRRRVWPQGRYIFQMTGKKTFSPRGPIRLAEHDFAKISGTDTTRRMVAVELGFGSICHGTDLIRSGVLESDWDIFDEWEKFSWAEGQMKEGNRVRHRSWPLGWYGFRMIPHLPAWALADKKVCSLLKEKIRIFPSAEFFALATENSIQELSRHSNLSEGWELTR